MPSKHNGRMRMSTQPFMMSHNRMMMSQNRIRPLGFFRAPVRPGMPPFSQPLQIRPPVSLAQGLPQWAGGRILGPMPTVIHPHLIPTHIPPPNMQPITPAPIVSIAASAPPNQPSTIPVIATINRDQPATKSGTPIPTVNHPIRKPADIDHQNRQVLFENRDSPTLSVKIRRSPSRSRSRSLSPYQRSSHRRTVLRPHRSRRRGKRSPTRKRSRRRTRSYSRSRSRSYSPPSRGRSPRREPQTKPG
uniref:Uncharacterized protein n=1 Tax=Ciona savignyi TaxID=51511 RepID=H2ZNC3_CIOSA